MTVEEKVARTIKKTGMTLAAVSRKTGIEYNKLQPSMKGRRELRADEYLKLCFLLGKDPRDLARDTKQ